MLFRGGRREVDVELFALLEPLEEADGEGIAGDMMSCVFGASICGMAGSSLQRQLSDLDRWIQVDRW